MATVHCDIDCRADCIPKSQSVVLGTIHVDKDPFLLPGVPVEGIFVYRASFTVFPKQHSSMFLPRQRL